MTEPQSDTYRGRETNHKTSDKYIRSSSFHSGYIRYRRRESRNSVGNWRSNLSGTGPASGPMETNTRHVHGCYGTLAEYGKTIYASSMFLQGEKGAVSTPNSVYYNYLFTYFILSIVRCIVWKRGFRIKLQI